MVNFRTHKDNLKLVDAQDEQRLIRCQKEYLELEVRKFRRKKLLAYHNLEQDLLRQELNKRQQQLEQAHMMLLRHHEKTQELEYRQQKAVHALREEQVRFFVVIKECTVICYTFVVWNVN
jgi:thousand and one amino acid protein kinase